MSHRRRRRDLRPAGAIAPRRLGFSAARARELELLSAWEQAAGPAIAARARPVALRRGELELRVAEPGWAATIDELLPELLARLDAALPERSIERGRLAVAGEPAPRPPRRAARGARGDVPTGDGDAPRASSRPVDRERSPAEPVLDDARLRRAMERYLARTTQKG